MEENKNLLVKKERMLAWLLRHDKSYKFDKHGWRTVEDIIVNHNYTQELLDQIVETSNKKRFEYNEDKTKIRARQGHSIQVDVELKEVIPPDILYHGTSKIAAESIKIEGLKKMNRLYVHLTDKIEMAKSTGMRHAKTNDNLCIFCLDCKKMVQDGFKFLKSNNGIYLIDHVPSKYLKIK